MPPTLSRRFLLSGAAAAGLAAPFLRAHAAEPLYINTWGGVWQTSAERHLFQPFTAATGMEIRTISPVSYAKLAAQARTRTYDFDVTTLSGNQLVQAQRENLTEAVNTNIVDTSAVPAENIYHNGVASHCFSTNVVYSKRAYPNGGMSNWADFWNLQRFPGKRSMNRNPADNMAIALLADGVPKESLYPIDADRAFRSLDRIKPAVPVWWTEGPQAAQLIREGEVQACAMWHSITFANIDAGVPIELSWNQAKINRAYWVVSRGTPRSENAWKFIQFATSPERLAGFCNAASYGPLNPKAFEHLPENISRRMPTYPENYRLCVEEDGASIGPMLTPLLRRFNTWVAS